MPMNFRPRFMQATPVVPLPMNGSSTISSAELPRLTAQFIQRIGFFILLPSFSAIELSAIDDGMHPLFICAAAPYIKQCTKQVNPHAVLPHPDEINTPPKQAGAGSCHIPGGTPKTILLAALFIAALSAGTTIVEKFSGVSS